MFPTKLRAHAASLLSHAFNGVSKIATNRGRFDAKKKGRPESTLKKSLGEDAYKACPLSPYYIFCASANSAIAVAYPATAIYRINLNSAAFVRSQNQIIFVAVRQKRR